jgi:hypothetical protein
VSLTASGDVARCGGQRQAARDAGQSKRQAQRSTRQDSSFFTQAALAGEESPLHASNEASHER